MGGPRIDLQVVLAHEGDGLFVDDRVGVDLVVVIHEQIDPRAVVLDGALDDLARRQAGDHHLGLRHEARAVLENGLVFVQTKDEQKPLPLIAPAHAIHQDGETLYVALGAQGVHVFKISAQEIWLRRQIPTPQGSAIGFFLSGIFLNDLYHPATTLPIRFGWCFHPTSYQNDGGTF